MLPFTILGSQAFNPGLVQFLLGFSPTGTLYDNPFSELTEDEQNNITLMMNWILNTENPSIADYEDMLDPDNLGMAEIPSTFCDDSDDQNTCQKQVTSLVVTTNITGLLAEIPIEETGEFEGFRFEVLSAFLLSDNCFQELQSYYSYLFTAEEEDGYEFGLIPLTAGDATYISRIVFDDDTVYTTIAYAYNYTSLEGIEYDGGGEFSYHEGFQPISLDSVLYKMGPVSIDSSGPLSFCEGNSVTLFTTTEGLSDFMWSNGDTTESIFVDTSGTYSLKVKKPFGCYWTSSLETEVNVHPLPEAPTPPTPQSSCSDTAVLFVFDSILAGSGGNQIEWALSSSFDTSEIIESNGSINLLVESGAIDTLWMRSRDSVTGCVSESVNIIGAVSYSPILAIEGDSVIALDESLCYQAITTDSAGINYSIIQGNAVIDSTSGCIYGYSESFTIRCTVTSGFCSSSILDKTVWVIQPPIVPGVQTSTGDTSVIFIMDYIQPGIGGDQLQWSFDSLFSTAYIIDTPTFFHITLPSDTEIIIWVRTRNSNLHIVSKSEKSKLRNKRSLLDDDDPYFFNVSHHGLTNILATSCNPQYVYVPKCSDYDYRILDYDGNEFTASTAQNMGIEVWYFSFHYLATNNWYTTPVDATQSSQYPFKHSFEESGAVEIHVAGRSNTTAGFQLSCTMLLYVYPQEPDLDFTFNDNVCPCEEVCLNLSTNYPSKLFDIHVLEWDLGTGTPYAGNPYCFIPSNDLGWTAGEHTITLKSSTICPSASPINKQEVETLTIVNPPLSFSEDISCATVNFTASSSCAASYQWYFGDGDGNHSNVQNPSFTYLQSGTYSVTLVNHLC
ncbi:MAG: PKD domain-containing protein [Bacteroidetes bacterium]|nr:PKD domain-containing protein [Bacteroidota bacterium]